MESLLSPFSGTPERDKDLRYKNTFKVAVSWSERYFNIWTFKPYQTWVLKLEKTWKTCE